MMKISVMALIMFLSVSCKESPPEGPQSTGQIVAYVHWQDQPESGKQVVLMQTSDTTFTDADGLAKFSVPPGHYVLRVFGINRGGPVFRFIDFDVTTKAGDTTKVDIVDCLPCV